MKNALPWIVGIVAGALIVIIIEGVRGAAGPVMSMSFETGYMVGYVDAVTDNLAEEAKELGADSLLLRMKDQDQKMAVMLKDIEVQAAKAGVTLDVHGIRESKRRELREMFSKKSKK